MTERQRRSENALTGTCAVLLLACAREAGPAGATSAGPAIVPRPEQSIPAPFPSTASSAATGRRDPQAAFTALRVSEYADAVVAHPSGGSPPYPLVIGLHGNFDRPEWKCHVWRRITRSSAYVLCPRGSRRRDSPETDPRFTYDTYAAVEAEVSAARAAFDARYGDSVDPKRIVLAGFSLGGVYAAHLAVKHPDTYSRVVLIEGGDKPWSAAAARRFSNAGGRALFVCAQAWCKERFTRVLRWFAKENVRFAYAAGAGHTYDGRVAEVTEEHWPFVSQSVERLTDQ